MTRVVEVDDEGVKLPLSRRRVAAIADAVLRAQKVNDAHLSITFVNNRRIAGLNRRHLGHSGATDVISFPLSGEPATSSILGDIYIAPDMARRNANEHGASLREELTRLVVHGVLHVLGFDHPDGLDRTASAMWRRQERLVRALMQPVSKHGRRARERSVA
jgi:probable rRNA maturation factor